VDKKIFELENADRAQVENDFLGTEKRRIRSTLFPRRPVQIELNLLQLCLSGSILASKLSGKVRIFGGY
jgi:hypothetical protein